MTTGRPRTFDEDETLQRVMKSFWKRGYDATTFEHLVADSKLSRSSLYNAFGGKEALFGEALDRYLSGQERDFLNKLNDSDTGGEFLMGLLDTFDQPHDVRSRGCLLQKTILQNAASGKKPRQGKRIGNTLKSMWSAFRNAISQVARSPAKSSAEPMTTDERAALVLAVMFGISVISRNGRNEELVVAITSGVKKLAEQR